MEAPPNPSTKKDRDATYKKTTDKNEAYDLNIKLKDKNTIYISIIFSGNNKTFEDIKTYEEIKQQQTYFEDYTIEEIFDEVCDLVSKNNIELNKNNEQILLSIILPSKKRKTLDFSLENKKMDNVSNVAFLQLIKQKDDVIKKLEEIIKQKDNIIKSLENIVNKTMQGNEIVQRT